MLQEMINISSAMSSTYDTAHFIDSCAVTSLQSPRICHLALLIKEVVRLSIVVV
jgi:hypothetical protein